MDNFEYSIQISDRDWAEFYQTAEECDLMKVSLASDEELLFSDPEHEDATPSAAKGKHKFIRVSLCPPQQEQSPEQTIPPTQKNYNWIVTKEDVLSGSEDEEDFGSVTQFLCQKDNSLFNVKADNPSIHIPIPKIAKEQCRLNPSSETSTTSQANISLVDQLMILNKNRNEQYGEDMLCNIKRLNTHGNILSGMCDNMENTSYLNNGHTDPGLLDSLGLNKGSLVQCSAGGSPETQVHFRGNDSSDKESILDCNLESDACAKVSPVNTSQPWKDESFIESEMNHSKIASTISVLGSLGEFGDLNFPKEISQVQTCRESIQDLTEPVNSKENMLLHLCNDEKLFNEKSTQTDIAGENMLHFNFTHPSSIKQNTPDFYTKNTSLGTLNSVRLNTGGCYNVLPNGNKTVSTTHSPINILEKVFGFLKQPSFLLPTLPQEDTANLTIPEMYDYFYDDVSESKKTDINPTTHSRDKEEIMYTPDMYEYFFVESDEERKRKREEKEEMRARAYSSSDLVFISNRDPKEGEEASAEFSVPEAYELFFTDGTENEKNSDGVIFGLKAFNAQSAAAAIQSFMPQGLHRVRKGGIVRGTHDCGARNGKENRSTPQSTTLTTTGSVAPYVSRGKGEACLVLLAIASWALKSADVQSSEGWKAALLTNIGAISAIHYLRQQTGENWQGIAANTGETD